MHNKEKYPEIWNTMVKKQDELKVLKVKRKSYTDQLDAVRVKQMELQPEIDALNEKAMEDYEQIKELSIEISNMAKAMGGVRLANTA